MDDHSVDQVGDDFRTQIQRELLSTAVGSNAQYRAWCDGAHAAGERTRPRASSGHGGWAVTVSAVRALGGRARGYFRRRVILCAPL